MVNYWSQAKVKHFKGKKNKIIIAGSQQRRGSLSELVLTQQQWSFQSPLWSRDSHREWGTQNLALPQLKAVVVLLWLKENGMVNVFGSVPCLSVAHSHVGKGQAENFSTATQTGIFIL